jgi:hypothetical protein
MRGLEACVELDNKLLWEILAQHKGHDIHIRSYGNPAQDICLECDDCYEVILSAETYTIEERTDLE